MNATDWIIRSSTKHDLFTLRTMYKYAQEPRIEKWEKYLSIKRLLRKVLNVGRGRQRA